MDAQPTAPAATKQTIWQTLWDKLTAPHPTIQNDEQRQRAHLLAALLVIFLPLFVIPESIRAIQTQNIIIFYWVIVAFLAAAYALSRSRHFQVGIVITLTVLTLLPIAGILSQGSTPHNLLSALIWMAPTVLIGSLLLSVRGTAVLGCVNIALGLALTRLLPDVAVRHLFYPLGYVATVLLLLVVAAAMRQRYMERIKVQSGELARSEEQFRALVENSHAGIIQVGADYRFNYVNSETSRILGVDRNNLIGRDFRTALDEESKQLVSDRYRRRQAGENVPSRYTFQVVRPDGEKRLIEISSSTYTSADGRTQTIAQLLDITEKKQIEDALRDSEALYQSLVNNLPQNIFRKDVDGRFTFANDNFCRAHGKSLTDIIGKTDFDLHPSEMAHKYRINDEHVMESGETFEGIEIFERLDGEKYYVQTVKTPTYDADGRLTGIQGIFWDITEIKQAQEALQQAHDELERRVEERTQELAAANSRLKQLDHLKNQFIEDMSHELRTPLANLNLYLDLLEMGNPEKQARYFSVLRQATKRLTHLSEDILTVTRLNLYKDEIHKRPIDINEIAGDIIQKQQHLVDKAGLELIFSPDKSLPPILAESDQIRQVVSNLLQNSLNYTTEGVIRVTTSLDETRQLVCLEVADTGMGIDEEDLPFLFDRFYRGKHIGQSTIPGSGLGLAVVKEIVELHEGSVEVSSRMGEGSVFRVWLPAAKRET